MEQLIKHCNAGLKSTTPIINSIKSTNYSTEDNPACLFNFNRRTLSQSSTHHIGKGPCYWVVRFPLSSNTTLCRELSIVGWESSILRRKVLSLQQLLPVQRQIHTLQYQHLCMLYYQYSSICRYQSRCILTHRSRSGHRVRDQDYPLEDSISSVHSRECG